VLGLSRANMKLLASEHPAVAVEVQANILRHAAKTRAALSLQPANLYLHSKRSAGAARVQDEETGTARPLDEGQGA
jgi:hypothetical protein